MPMIPKPDKDDKQHLRKATGLVCVIPLGSGSSTRTCRRPRTKPLRKALCLLATLLFSSPSVTSLQFRAWFWFEEAPMPPSCCRGPCRRGHTAVVRNPLGSNGTCNTGVGYQGVGKAGGAKEASNLAVIKGRRPLPWGWRSKGLSRTPGRRLTSLLPPQHSGSSTFSPFAPLQCLLAGPLSQLAREAQQIVFQASSPGEERGDSGGRVWQSSSRHLPRHRWAVGTWTHGVQMPLSRHGTAQGVKASGAAGGAVLRVVVRAAKALGQRPVYGDGK